MCGGSAPQDNSHKVAQIEAQAAREAREAEERRKAQERADFDARLSSAFGIGIDDAMQYFSSMGLDPDQYAGSISNYANQVKGSVPLLDSAPGTYFNNLGQQVFGREQDSFRNQMMRALDTVAPNNFATRRIGNDVDDAMIESILAEQFSTAEGYIRNLLDRGVITGGGFDAARRNLEGQRPGATSRLNEIGMGLIEGGRGGAENIANQARSTASNLRLGQQFDPYETGTDLNNYFMDFFNNLGTKFRAASPSSLFDTSGLAGVAGASQGAQNLAFDPKALAGITNQPEDEEEDSVFGGPF